MWVGKPHSTHTGSAEQIEAAANNAFVLDCGNVEKCIRERRKKRRSSKWKYSRVQLWVMCSARSDGRCNFPSHNQYFFSLFCMGKRVEKVTINWEVNCVFRARKEDGGCIRLSWRWQIQIYDDERLPLLEWKVERWEFCVGKMWSFDVMTFFSMEILSCWFDMCSYFEIDLQI